MFSLGIIVKSADRVQLCSYERFGMRIYCALNTSNHNPANANKVKMQRFLCLKLFASDLQSLTVCSLYYTEIFLFYYTVNNIIIGFCTCLENVSVPSVALAVREFDEL